MEQKYGLAVDLVGAAMKGLVLYSILVVTSYWNYLDGGRFQPALASVGLVYVIVLGLLYSKLDGKLFVLSHIICLLVWYLIGRFFRTEQIYYMISGIVFCAESIIQKFVQGKTEKKRYARRYRMQNYLKWGVLLALISVLLPIGAKGRYVHYDITVQDCANYIVAAFGVYLFTVVLMKYMFLEYDYTRNKDSLEKGTMKRLSRMNKIVSVVSVGIIGIAIIVTRETIVTFAEKLFITIFGTAIGATLLGLSKIPVKQLSGSGELSGVPEGAARVRVSNFNLPVEKIVMVLLIVAIIYLLCTLYKKHGAGYSIEGEEAEYVSAGEIEKWTASAVDAVRDTLFFSKDNRGKIRKIYYKLMKNRMKEKNKEEITGKTPHELAAWIDENYEKKNLGEATRLYEKARYAKEDCTDEELKKMKEVGM